MYVVVRRYAGGGGKGEALERARRVRAGFLPLLRQQAGFHAYSMFADEDGGANSIIAFERPEDAVAAHHDIRRWATANLHDLTPGPPDLVSGEVLHEDLVPRQLDGPTCVTVTILDGLPPAGREAPQQREAVLPMLLQQPAMRGIYVFRSEIAAGRWVGVGILDGPGATMEAGERIRRLIRSMPMEAGVSVERNVGGRALVGEPVQARPYPECGTPAPSDRDRSGTSGASSPPCRGIARCASAASR